jgi:chromosome segregation ATPase
VPESVAKADEVPSPEATSSTEDEAAPTTDFEAEATEYKKRFAGSQKALTETQKERDALKAERDALAAFKATAERSNMSEVEAAKADAELARQEAAAARAEAHRERLARQFPLAIAELGDDEPVPSEAALARLEAKIAAAAPGDETERTPRIDPNNPRRATPMPRGDKTGDELVEDLKQYGNPFAGT